MAVCKRTGVKLKTKSEYLEAYPWMSWMWEDGICINGRVHIKCGVCGGEFTPYRHNVYQDYCGDGIYRCMKCSNSKAFRTQSKNGVSPMVKASHTPECSKVRLEHAVATMRSNGWYESDGFADALRKSCETNNRRREERGGSWANESDWEQEIADEFSGVCGLKVFFEYDRKSRWPDIVFTSGHVIQIDDKSHRIGKKSPTYEQEYDKACIHKYGKRPLHLIIPQDATLRRERFVTWRDVVQAYLNDELNDDEYILLDDPLYKGIQYNLEV